MASESGPVGGFLLGKPGGGGRLWAKNLAELIGAFGVLGPGRYWIRFVMVEAGTDLRRIASSGVGDWGCLAILEPGTWILANDPAALALAEGEGRRP